MNLSKKFVALFLVLAISMLSFVHSAIAKDITAETTTSSHVSMLKQLGFELDKDVYTEISKKAIAKKVLYDNNKNVVFRIYSYAWICRAKDMVSNKCQDIALVSTIIEEGKWFTLNGATVGFYPEALTTKIKFGSGHTYITSCPKTATSTSSYTVGIGATGSNSGASCGITGSMTFPSDSLRVRNRSTGNSFNVLYDYNPGFFGQHSNYVCSTTEQIGVVLFENKVKSYSLKLDIDVELGMKYKFIIDRYMPLNKKTSFSNEELAVKFTHS